MDFAPRLSLTRRRESSESSPEVGAHGFPDSRNGHQTGALDAAAKYSAVAGKDPGPPHDDPDTIDVPLWMRRVSLVIFVAFCVELGMILVVLPWTPFWSENSLLLDYPALRSILRENFVRGLISGVGLIDVWMGIWEAAHYREPKRR